ncbi:AraC family transcriptional regulator [Kistimonas asteriae]|uniref:AraC family transcriptional regulator n=1 Tax=Kistimonas asteriae TaxID=517724 RepID=UPI001BA65A83|nr:AraC family transcriptional regulator [Kistimonas asteriae]
MYNQDSRSTIAGCFVVAALYGVQARQGDVGALLDQAGIDRAVMDDQNLRVPREAFTRLILLIRETLQDEFLGLSQMPCPVGAFAMMCHACMTCETLGQALERCIRFLSLVTHSIELSLRQDEDEVALTLLHERAEGLDDRFLIETLLVSLVRWSSWMIDRHIVLRQVDFAFDEPAHRDEYLQIFPCRCRFNRRATTLFFSSSYLSAPVVQQPLTLKSFLAQAPANLMSHYRHDDSVSALIRKRLSGLEPAEFPTFDAIAGWLHLSPPTLRRRLKDEGASYRGILDAVRRDRAIFHLSRNELPVAAIASLTGFAEPSTFHRAFKKWTGLTPGAWRASKQVASEAG